MTPEYRAPVLLQNNISQLESFHSLVGVFNALEGCDGEIEMTPGMTEAEMGQLR